MAILKMATSPGYLPLLSFDAWSRRKLVSTHRTGLWLKVVVSALAIALLSARSAQSQDNRYQVSRRAAEIHAQGYVFDGHNDLPWELRAKAPKLFDDIDIAKPQPSLHTDIPRLRAGNVGAQFWSVFVPVDTIAAGNAFQTTKEQIDLVHRMIALYPDTFALALNGKDVDRIRAEGKIASLIGMEGGHSIEGSIGKLRQLYAAGARYMTLTHSETLEWADSATDVARNDGLSEFGEEVVREMNRLGMLVDISHVSPATMHDALRVSTAPVIFSHSSARALAEHPRNVPDDVLEALPKNGGVVMINFFSGFVVPESAKQLMELTELRKTLKAKYPGDKESQEREIKQWQVKNPYPAGNAEILIDHIEHVIKVAGIDHVGLGSDFDGVTKLPVGMEDVSKYPVITELLLRRGYDEEAIHKVLYGNALRVLREATE